jgi:hypothetical protein
MTRTIFTTAFLLFTVYWGWAQPYHRLRLIGSHGDEKINDFVSSTDGNFIAVGEIVGDETVADGDFGHDALVAKVSPDGEIIWAYTCGNLSVDQFVKVVRHKGFYYCLGTNYPNSSRFNDMFLIKIDENGTLQWAKGFGSTDPNIRDIGFVISETSDEDIIIAGTTNNDDIIIFRVRPNGTVVFEKRYGSDNATEGFRPLAMIRSGKEYVLAGMKSNPNTAMLLKIDENGNLLWARKFGLPDASQTTSISSLFLDPERNKLVTAGYYSGISGSDPILFNDIRWSDGAPVAGSGPRAKIFSVNSMANSKGEISPKGNNQKGVFINFFDGVTSITEVLPGGVVNNLVITTGVVLASLDTSFSIVENQCHFRNFTNRNVYRSISPAGRLHSIAGTNDIVSIGRMGAGGNSCGGDIYFARFKSDFKFDSTTTDTSQYCSRFAPIEISSTNYTNTDMFSNVIVSGTGLTHYDITSLPYRNITDKFLLRYDRCGCATGITTSCDPPLPATASFVLKQNETKGDVEIKGSIDPAKKKDIVAFSFIVHDLDDLVYYETDKEENLKNGVNLKKSQKDLPSGLYFWKYKAVLTDGRIDIQEGAFTIK